MEHLRMSDASRQAMLRAARNIVVPAMKRVARIKTKKGADAVNIHETADAIEVRAGYPEGAYGWTPIQAAMFESNGRHPLFGNKRHWYSQGYWPITKRTVQLVGKLVEDEYVDEALRIILKDHHFDL